MGKSSRSYMNEETLRLFIEQHISQSGQQVYFTWQGGEPLMAGLDFYQSAIRIQKEIVQKYPEKAIFNAIQTNGMLINDQWAKFFKKENILIGLSIDGNRHHHDFYRVNNRGQGTFDRVMRGFSYLKKHEVEFNTLTVINRHNADSPIEVYNFLKEIGSRFLQFIPVVETMNIDDHFRPLWISDATFQPEVSEFSLEPGQFASFMKAIFAEWLRHDLGKITIQLFESILAAYCGYGHSLCVFKEHCGGDNLALEANGDVYQCDHFVYPSYRIGNIRHLDEATIMEHSVSLSEKKAEKNPLCQQCLWRVVCYGGCPKHRFVLQPDGGRHNYFCKDYLMLFPYLNPAMNFLATLISEQTSLSLAKPYVEELLHQGELATR